ncbi:MAG: transporter substrate-binding domain-containing protein [Proteobacteria bacterium]|nr:transporter substrate-binding domain-containing protein [Pseudomonadota bacterium]
MTHPTLSRRNLLCLTAAASSLTALGMPFGARAAGLTVAGLKAAGTLRVGCEAAYVPFTYRNDKGEIVGYDVDLAQLVWAAHGIKPEFVDTAWAGVIPSLYAKKFDLVMSCMSYTAERVKRVAFSIPYAEASQALLIRAGDTDKIKSVEDLNGKIIGIKLGSPGEVLHKKLAEQKKLTYKEVRIFDDHPAAYIALGQSKVDAVFNTVPTLAIVLKDAPGKYALVRGIGADNWAGIAGRQEDTDLIRHVDETLTALKADGRLAQLQEKWFGFKMVLADKIPTFEA